MTEISMTNAEFEEFVQRRFGGNTSAASKELEVHRDTIDSLRTGQTRKGGDYPVPRHIALAVRAIDMPEPPQNLIASEQADPDTEIEFHNGIQWVTLNDGWFGPNKDTMARWSKMKREWPSAAKIVAGAMLGFPVRIKGKRSSAEQIARMSGDEFVRRLPE